MARMFLKWPPVEASRRPLNQCFLQGPSDPSEALMFFRVEPVVAIKESYVWPYREHGQTLAFLGRLHLFRPAFQR